ncbi:MAG: PHP domain-containing protein [Chlamydiota bacterium]
MSEFRADLHCHTTASDGTLNPQEIIEEAIRCGLKGLSITDHDTIEAYHEAAPAAMEMGIELIPGVEFSTEYMGSNVHVLAYSFNTRHPSIIKLCEYHKERRVKRFFKMLEKLQEKGVHLKETDFDLNDGSIGRPHLAKSMIAGGYVRSVPEAFKKYLGDDQPCYVNPETISTEETIKIIHEANAYAVIAHPHLINNQNTLLGILELPFDGIEAYYARFSPSQEKRWVKIGEYRGWLITGGSDFHGNTKPNLPLGCSWVRSESFNQLKQRYQENLID